MSSNEKVVNANSADYTKPIKHKYMFAMMPPKELEALIQGERIYFATTYNAHKAGVLSSLFAPVLGRRNTT